MAPGNRKIKKSHFGRLSAKLLVFYKQHVLSSAVLKLAKNQAKAKQHPETELLLTENYLLSSSTLSSKNNGRFSKKRTKRKYVCLNEII